MLTHNTNEPSSSMIITQVSGPLIPTCRVKLSLPSRPMTSSMMPKLVHFWVIVLLMGKVMVREAGVKSALAEYRENASDTR